MQAPGPRARPRPWSAGSRLAACRSRSRLQQGERLLRARCTSRCARLAADAQRLRLEIEVAQTRLGRASRPGSRAGPGCRAAPDSLSPGSQASIRLCQLGVGQDRPCAPRRRPRTASRGAMPDRRRPGRRVEREIERGQGDAQHRGWRCSRLRTDRPRRLRRRRPAGCASRCRLGGSQLALAACRRAPRSRIAAQPAQSASASCPIPLPGAQVGRCSLAQTSATDGQRLGLTLPAAFARSAARFRAVSCACRQSSTAAPSASARSSAVPIVSTRYCCPPR